MEIGPFPRLFVLDLLSEEEKQALKPAEEVALTAGCSSTHDAAASSETPRDAHEDVATQVLRNIVIMLSCNVSAFGFCYCLSVKATPYSLEESQNSLQEMLSRLPTVLAKYLINSINSALWK
jgi:hypothetical protein